MVNERGGDIGLDVKPGSEIFVVYTDERDTLGRPADALRNRAFVVKVNRLCASRSRYETLPSVTSKTSVEFPGIGPLAVEPYPRCGGMTMRRVPPTDMPRTP